MASGTEVREDPAWIDENFAFNLRWYREAARMTQKELAQRMVGQGFGFSQATVWKIEQAKRPARIGEAIALTYAVGALSLEDMTVAPERVSQRAELERRRRQVHNAYEAIKAATAAYIEARASLVMADRDASDNAAVTIVKEQPAR